MAAPRADSNTSRRRQRSRRREGSHFASIALKCFS